MSDLEVRPVVEIAAEIRRARSSCCAAPLDPRSTADMVFCSACGGTCERVLGEPEQVSWNG